MLERTRFHRIRRAALAAATGLALAVALGATASPALAHGGHGRYKVKHHKHHEHHGYVVHERGHHVERHRVRTLPYHRHGRFVVPSRIRVHGVATYRPYYHGRVYYGAHRHHHEVYRFPVYTSAGLVYRPHAYCGERLYVSGGVALHGRNFSLRVDF